MRRCKMKKIFISQPMRGRADEEIRAEREAILAQVAEKFPSEDVQEIKSFIPDEFHESDWKNVGLAYLGKSLMMLAEADLAVFVQGYADARGCKIEHEAAAAYNVNRMYM